MSTYVVSEAPTATLMTPTNARLELTIASDDDGITDAELESKIADATGRVEDMSGHILLPQTMQLKLDDWPRGGIIQIEKYPVNDSDLAITYKNEAGTDTPLASTDYDADMDSYPARILLKETYDLEEDALNRITVEFKAGHAAGTVPKGLMDAFKMFLWDAFEDRIDKPLSKGVNNLLTRAEQICLRHRKTIF